jgi:hypothetical protein
MIPFILATSLLAAPLHARAANRSPALLELFTSQGCSSCPPADDLLAELAARQPVPGIQIIPLAFHVDYWDHLGWTDPFAMAAYTRRQYAYAAALGDSSVYTPEAVINGSVGVVGHHRGAILDALKPLARLGLRREGGRLLVTGLRPGLGLGLWVAVAEDGLSTAVGRGENAGQRLAQPAVVRALWTVDVKGERVWVPLKLEAGWDQHRLRLVAFQARAEGAPVESVGSCPWLDGPT